jgi:hypothetical protein
MHRRTPPLLNGASGDGTIVLLLGSLMTMRGRTRDLLAPEAFSTDLVSTDLDLAV